MSEIGIWTRAGGRIPGPGSEASIQRSRCPGSDFRNTGTHGARSGSGDAFTPPDDSPGAHEKVGMTTDCAPNRGMHAERTSAVANDGPSRTLIRQEVQKDGFSAPTRTAKGEELLNPIFDNHVDDPTSQVAREMCGRPEAKAPFGQAAEPRPDRSAEALQAIHELADQGIAR